MKHIKIEFVESLVAIQRVRNEVFLGDDNTLWVLSGSVARLISKYLWVEGIPNHSKERGRGRYRKIALEDPYMRFIAVNGEDDEIIVRKGRDRVWVEDELGVDVTPSDEECFECKANMFGGELGI